MAFNYLQPLNGISLSVLIRDSYFRNNSVQAAVTGQQTTSQLLRRNLPTGRGGGCAVNVNSITSVSVLVQDCIFERNFALTYGGGLYCAWDKASGHTTILNRTMFMENESPGGAGGVELGFARGGTNGNRVFAYDLRFVRNRATYGGGAYVFIAGKFSQHCVLVLTFYQLELLQNKLLVASDHPPVFGLAIKDIKACNYCS